jgi:serine/threonine protein kinase
MLDTQGEGVGGRGEPSLIRAEMKVRCFITTGARGGKNKKCSASAAAVVALASPEELLRALIEKGLLTQYQGDRIAAGKTFGLVLGNYRVLDRLRAGAMGVVFLAEHIRLRCLVAVKVSPLYEENSRLLHRFFAEMRTVAQLKHPNIVGAMDAGKVEGPDGEPALHYFVMEHVPGQDLEEAVRQHGPFAPPKACNVISQIAAALGEAHKYQLVHRDIKWVRPRC